MEMSQEASVDYEAATIICVIGEIFKALLFPFSEVLLTTHSGGPGVGKGTQCTRLAADLRLVHISVGDLLREDALRPSLNHDLQIKTIMSNASLVPYYHVRNVLNLCLIKHMQNGRSNFLIDGFPRSEEQAHFFEGGESILSTRASLVGKLTVATGLESKGSSSLSLL